MKKMHFYVVGVLLAVLMCTACGKQSTQKNVSGKFNRTGYPILNEKETFDIYVSQLSPIVAANDKPAVKKAIEETNVVTNFIEVAASSWEEKVNILFSADALPDAFLGNMNVAEKYEQLASLDEYLTEEIAPNVVRFFNSRPEYWDILRAPDGHIHSLPMGDETYWNVVDSQLYINSDWLKAVGKDVPKNAEELRDVLRAFKNGDPNGNGDKNDEVPMTFRGIWGWGDGMENALSAFGVFESAHHVMTKNDIVSFAAQQPAYFDALKYYHELYKEGLIDSECFTHSQEQYKAKLADSVNKYGVVICYDKKQPWIPLLLADKDGNITVGINNVEHTDGFSISKTCKNPGALVRWYDYCNKDTDTILAWNRGVENEMWKYETSADGEKKIVLLNDPEIQKKYGATNKAELRNIQSFAGKSPAYLDLSYTGKLQGEKHLKPELNEKILANGYGVRALPPGFSTAENSSRRVILLADIDNYIKKFVATSVVDGIDDKGWEQHLDILKKLKVDEYTQLCQEFVNNQKKR